MQNYINFAVQIDSNLVFQLFQRITNYPNQILSPRKIKISLYQSKKNKKNYLKQQKAQFWISSIQDESLYFFDSSQKSQKMINKESAYLMSDINILQTVVFQKITGQIQKKKQTEYEVITYKWGGYLIELLQTSPQVFLLIISNQNGSTLFNKIDLESIRYRLKCIFQEVIEKLFNNNNSQFYLDSFSKFVYEQIQSHMQITSRSFYLSARKAQDGNPKNIQNLLDINFSLLKYAKILQIHKLKKQIDHFSKQLRIDVIQPQMQQMKI